MSDAPLTEDDELAAMEGRDRQFGKGELVGEAARDRRRLIATVRALQAEGDAYQDEAAATIRRLAGEVRALQADNARLRGGS